MGATVMYQLNPTATTATLCLMVTSQDTVTMAMQYPTDTSPEPDMDIMATLYLMSQMQRLMVTSQDTVTMAMQHPTDTSPEPDMDIMATLYRREPDMDTMATLYLMSQMQHPH